MLAPKSSTVLGMVLVKRGLAAFIITCCITTFHKAAGVFTCSTLAVLGPF